MEGVTDYIFRNTYNKFYGGIDKYYTPFICPHELKGFTAKEKKDICIEHNTDIKVVPQLLGNNADYFVSYISKLSDIGYDEININLGCPSGTVVSKRRGSGFLAYPDELNAFLEEVYNRTASLGIHLSLKTRLGLKDPDEIIKLLDIYNQYPVYELTVHPRVREDYYKGAVRMEQFNYVYANAKMPLVYNGDLCSISDIVEIEDKYPKIVATMLGRGLVGCPWILHAESTYATACPDIQKFKQFHDSLFSQYREILSGDTPLLFRMKEFMAMWQKSFPNNEKLCKNIMKTKSVAEYQSLISQLLS